MSYEFILTKTFNQIATITLNRPDKHNALHGPLLEEILSALKQFADDESRVLVIQGNGKNFCAGGDIAWMQKMADADALKNDEDANLFATVLYNLYSFPKPTVVMTQGKTLGGGMGLLAAADIAVATKNAIFGLPEVKIGVTPSMISPYVISAIGERAAHFYFLTGEHFTAKRAYELGLIHEVVDDDALENMSQRILHTLLQNSPAALKEAKLLIRDLAKEKIDEVVSLKTAHHLAQLRRTPEAQEGLRAFLEKRLPQWITISKESS